MPGIGQIGRPGRNAATVVDEQGDCPQRLEQVSHRRTFDARLTESGLDRGEGCGCVAYHEARHGLNGQKVTALPWAGGRRTGRVHDLLDQLACLVHPAECEQYLGAYCGGTGDALRVVELAADRQRSVDGLKRLGQLGAVEVDLRERMQHPGCAIAVSELLETGQHIGEHRHGRRQVPLLETDDGLEVPDPVDQFCTAAAFGRVESRLDGALAIRSAFTALPLDRLNEPPSGQIDGLLRDRLQLTRYLCDLGLALALAP
jgi:hypothetical protein